jgi:hypothetical protein
LREGHSPDSNQYSQLQFDMRRQGHSNLALPVAGQRQSGSASGCIRPKAIWPLKRGHRESVKLDADCVSSLPRR